MNDTQPLESEAWGKRSGSEDEALFLEGPTTRRSEFARAVRIFLELIRGFRALHFVGPCVTVFGSARRASLRPTRTTRSRAKSAVSWGAPVSPS